MLAHSLTFLFWTTKKIQLDLTDANISILFKKVREVNTVIAEVIFFEVRELAKILASTILVIKTTTISGDESQDIEEAEVYS